MVLAPFNSLVLETVTCSKAFAVASTAAIIVLNLFENALGGQFSILFISWAVSLY